MSAGNDLRSELETLGGLLEQMLSEQVGPGFVARLRRVRQLAGERRAGLPGAGGRLNDELRAMDEGTIGTTIRALSLHFDLANVAEDLKRARVLRARATQQHDRPRAESISDAISRLKQHGLSAVELQRRLDDLRIDLVFTAHPTEAKRRTSRRILRRLRERLRGDAAQEAGAGASVNAIGDAVSEALLSELTLLWQIDPVRPRRPTVIDEVERGIFFFECLWNTVPELRKQLQSALAEHYPGHSFRVPTFLRFGSWIGGDRDGNPFVTAEVTARALSLLRRAATQRHLAVCRELADLLVISDRLAPADEQLKAALAAALDATPELREAVESVADVEVYRRWLKVIECRLLATLQQTELATPTSSVAYRGAAALAADVQLLAESLMHHRGARIAVTYLDRWREQIATFGLQFAALDVRQDSRTHTDVLAELFQRTNRCADYHAATETQRRELLLSDPPSDWGPTAGELSPAATETLALFKLLARVARDQGLERLGGHIVSMTHQTSDLLAVWWFWRWAWRQVAGAAVAMPALPVVPLFETIDDLHRGPAILEDLLAVPAYAAYLASSGTAEPTQLVMVGYSDSTKDGGYLAASWALFQVQEQLAEQARRHGVRLVIFHGRGGALGRGGGPAARAILSLPPRSVRGALRMTEQGEVIAERYDDPTIALRHMEQVTWGTLLVSSHQDEGPPAGWSSAMEQLAETSLAAYRKLVNHAGFLAYFDQATPISDIENLPIGSRPSRRRERRSLADLRAIPWTFAWTQSRHFLPAWFGLGTALTERVLAQQDDWSELRSMYREWPYFQALIDNAELALAKSDLDIARGYAELTDDAGLGLSLWQLIAEEFQRTRAAVLLVKNETDLLADIPWLQQSIHERNPSIDPLNLIQIELIRRRRAAHAAGDAAQLATLAELSRLAIQGIASGLRTTG